MLFKECWISIICAVVALIVTVIIAVLQIRQSNRMERFEKRQDKRDEQRHQESVKAQAVSFISKYYKDRGLIPLCAIATMYNDLFYYNREMYREFCCCTKEVQNRILEYCGLDLRVSEYSIYEKCLVAIESVLNKRFPDDKSVFYDGGKYFTRSLEYYAAKPIPHQEFEYQNHITDVLANAFNSNDKKATPIQQLSVEYNFESCEGIETCQLVTVIAEFSAIYGNKNKNIDKSYGSPGGYDGEVIETMEDLFLGQMDMYIRMYDELKRSEGDNPTIGIVLCSDTDDDIARYSVMHGNEQLFASKYKLYLPTKEELKAEIETQKAMFYLQQQDNEDRNKNYTFNIE